MAGVPYTDNVNGLESTTGYTIDELARKVAMSARNIRAHQARRLLPPPVRSGRTVLYDDSHLRRLEAIKALQRQGFNLVAIEAILGIRGAEVSTEALAGILRRLSNEQPALVYELSRHGVLVRGEDGSVRTARPRLLHSALDLRHAGVQPGLSLQLLKEILDRVRLIADELVSATGARIIALTPELAGSGALSWEEFDRNAMVLTQGLIGLLTEAFRVAVENSGQTSVPDLLAQRFGGEVQLQEIGAVDNG